MQEICSSTEYSPLRCQTRRLPSALAGLHRISVTLVIPKITVPRAAICFASCRKVFILLDSTPKAYGSAKSIRLASSALVILFWEQPSSFLYRGFKLQETIFSTPMEQFTILIASSSCPNDILQSFAPPPTYFWYFSRLWAKWRQRQAEWHSAKGYKIHRADMERSLEW